MSQDAKEFDDEELAELSPGLASFLHWGSCPSCLGWVRECGTRGTIQHEGENWSVPFPKDEDVARFLCARGQALVRKLEEEEVVLS